jgi:hypothetical protein
MAAKAMQRVLESGKLKRFLDPRLTKALAHPFREHLLAVYNERPTSFGEIEDELGIGLPDFHKHAKVLQVLGVAEEIGIERTGAKPRRGRPPRFFRATTTMLFDEQAWPKVPASVKTGIAASHIHSIMEEVVAALRAGMFAADDQAHSTWLPGIYDTQGWAEILALMNEVLARMMQIHRLSAERVAISGEPGIAATIGMLGFKTPPAGFAL